MAATTHRTRAALSLFVSVFAFAAVGLLTAGAGSAFAAETLIEFNGLAVGSEVKDQYEAQGLKLGTAEELGQKSPGEGNCGAPVAQESNTLEVPSPPGYAKLQGCLDEFGSRFVGTYGELLDASAGPMSLYVRSLQASAPPVQVKLIAYDSSGHEIASQGGVAEPDAWSKITLNPGSAKIGFFLLRSKEALASGSIGIDNLSFQAPESPPPEGEKTTSTSSQPPPPTPPTSVISLLTSSPHPGQPVTLSGESSSPGSGHIISYEWDFNNDGKIDTSTATNPIAHFMFPSGVHTVALTVTNSSGEKSTSRIGVSVGVAVSISRPDGGEGECEASFEITNVELLAECIQKVPGGGYVIESHQMSVNGMVMASKEGGYGVWHIQVFRRYGVGTEYKLSGTPVTIELPNTPIGDLVLGGRNLETEPILLALEPEQRTLPVVHLSDSPRAHAADEEHVKNLKGNPLLSFGVGHACSAGSKESGCCPPPGLGKACATLPGGFPLTGSVVVYLTGKGQALFDVQVGLELKSVSFQATGELELLASSETGIELSSLRFNIPEASLAPIFKVKEASFVYYFPGNPDPEKRDTWQAKATITFGLLEEPGLEGELSFQHGQFHSAALALTLPPPGIPVYPGIDLNKMGGSVGVEPITFGGSLGAKIASVLELELAFKYAEATEQQLGFFGGKGVLKYEDNEIATLEADVYSDGYSDALLLLKIGVPFGSKSPVVSAEGEIGYWDESSTGLWEAYGRVHAKIWVLEGELAGIVNNHYIAGCAFLGPFGALGYWDFDTSSLGGEGFVGGNCHDDLTPYKQVPLTKHTGGFVNETETESLRPRLVSAPPLTPLARLRTGGGQQATIALAGAPLGRDLRINSNSGTPVVKLVGPNGQSFTTPAAPGQVAMSGSQFIAALGSNPHQAIVYLSEPAGGEWHIHEAPGSAPISSVEVAEVTPPPTIHTTVRHLHGGSWALSYKLAHLASGSKVRFYERGKDSIHGIGTVSAARGTLTFKPAEALSRPRKIYATVISSTGAPLETLEVGSYTAPRPLRPARVSRLRFVRSGKTAVLSWGAVAGARVYRVRVKGSDGRLDTFFASHGRRSETLPNVLPSESFTATVTAVGDADLLPGPAASVKLAAVTSQRSKRRR